jgi:hypothetical protein
MAKLPGEVQPLVMAKLPGEVQPLGMAKLPSKLQPFVLAKLPAEVQLFRAGWPNYLRKSSFRLAKLPGEVQPLRMAEFVSNEVEISLPRQTMRQQPDHLSKKRTNIEKDCT